MPVTCPLHAAVPMRPRARVAVSYAVLCLSACHPTSVPVPHAAADGDFSRLVSKGDYAGAIAVVEKSSLEKSEKDGVSGNLILDGWVDPSATTRPPYTLAEGFARLERAAAAGRPQSIADLRAKFMTGLNYEGKNVLMGPVDSLAQCWAQVEAGSGKALTCIAVRERLGVP